MLVCVTAGGGVWVRGQANETVSSQDSRRAERQDPELKERPAPKPQSPLTREGRIKLDVMVNDVAGKPVLSLDPWDFKILDNGQPRKVLSFHAYDGVQVKPDPPVEVILALDMMNLPFQQVGFVRGQVDEFLRQNGGRLKQPIRLVVVTEKGIEILPRASTDGNAIASVVDGIKGHVSSINPAMGSDGALERFHRSTRDLDDIAQNMVKKPGRKMLIWVGPGWPLLDRPADGYTEKQQKRNFSGIIELSTALREARMTVYSVAPAGAFGFNPLHYQKFLEGVRTYKEAESGDMALKVLATQTGGKILGPDNDLVTQLNECMEDANAFYRISFDPPPAQHADEYHDLKINVGKPGVTVRTNTGYYNQPADH